MFFVFYILVMINYIPLSNNYVLNRINHQHDNHAIKPEVCNNSFHFTTRRLILGLQESLTNKNHSKPLNLHHYDKKLTNEMLSIKQNINDNNRFATLKNTDLIDKNMNRPKQIMQPPKASAVDKDLYNVDDFDFRHLFPEEKFVEQSSNENPAELSIRDNVKEQHNKSKNKVVDLRSLTGHELSEEGDEPKIKTIDSSTCNRSQINPRALGFAGHNIQTIAPSAHGCNGCSRTTVSYSLLPYYMPYQPYYYHGNIHTVSRQPINDLFYENDKHNHIESDNDVVEDEVEGQSTKSHKRKKHRHRKKYKTTVADDDHEMSFHEEKFDSNNVFLDSHSNKLAKEILDDLSAAYPDTVIKKCYCSSATAFSYFILLFTVTILFTFSETFIKILLQE